MHPTVVDPVRPSSPAQPHAPWCDLQQHALAQAEAIGPTGCVGRYIAHGGMGGWVTEDVREPGTGSRFVLDWRPAEGWESMRPEEAAALGGLLARLMAEQRRPEPATVPVQASAPAWRLFARSRRQPA